MAPRPRKQKNRALPPNLYETNGGKTFIYRHPITGTRHGMGPNKPLAIAAAKELNARLMGTGDLVKQVLGQTTLRDHWEWFVREQIEKRDYAAKTVEMYRTQGKKILDALGDRPVEELGVKQFADLMAKHSARVALQIRQVSVDLMRSAMARGLCEINPAEKTLKPIYKKARKRLSMDDFRKIHAAADPWLQNAMDIGLVTLQRREDIVRMRFDQVKDGVLYVVQIKTEKHDTGYLAIHVGKMLASIIRRCRDDVASPFLVHREFERIEEGKEHWTQVLPEYLTRAFTELRDKVGVCGDLPSEQRPTFHEIRALGIKWYREQKIDPQQLAGHASAKMTKNYEAGHDEIRWVETQSF